MNESSEPSRNGHGELEFLLPFVILTVSLTDGEIRSPEMVELRKYS